MSSSINACPTSTLAMTTTTAQDKTPVQTPQQQLPPQSPYNALMPLIQNPESFQPRYTEWEERVITQYTKSGVVSDRVLERIKQDAISRTVNQILAEAGASQGPANFPLNELLAYAKSMKDSLSDLEPSTCTLEERMIASILKQQEEGKAGFKGVAKRARKAIRNRFAKILHAF